VDHLDHMRAGAQAILDQVADEIREPGGVKCRDYHLT
jgi:hypothetical protein